jgi:hypothetical protein
LPQHHALIEQSGITPKVAVARGYRSVTTKAELRRLGFAQSQYLVPCLLIPIHGVDGQIASYQIRPDQPRVKDGRTLKYETPAKSAIRLDVPPLARPWLADPSRPLVITEGARKADAGCSQGLCVIDVLGVWGWRGTNDVGGTAALADFESIALKGRDVYLCFDSDVMTKPSVRHAIDRLAAFLQQRQATVHYLLLPMGEGGAKTGLDDYLVEGHSTTDLFALAVDRLPPTPAPETAKTSTGPYRIVDGGIAWVRPSGDDEQVIRLTNFTAEIVEEVVADDGQAEQGELVIRGRLETGERLRDIRVATHRFDSLSWVPAQWGVRPIISAGQGGRDRVREAIQRLSPDITHRREYTHPGWREIDGTWCYLTQASVIGPSGAASGIAVRLSGSARSLRLDVPSESDLRDSVAAFLGLLTLAPDRLMIPLLGGVLRALLNVIAQADLALFLVGPSGAMKSELAAVIQRCFGPDFDRLHLPASWASTPNALERIAFDFKDAIVVIDDFAPAGSMLDVRRYHGTAERVIRGAGNAAGRERMQADGTVRASLPPRALILGTGEDIPNGYSIRARSLVLEVSRGDINSAVLSAYQTKPKRSQPARMLGGYIRWLAGHMERLKTDYPVALGKTRDDYAAVGAHARTPDALAGIGVAWRLWCRFAVEQGFVTKDDATTLLARVDTALRVIATAQAAYLTQENPVQRFLDLLAGALASGTAHVAGPDGTEPMKPAAWGWREQTIGTGDHERDEWRPQGRCVGWLANDGLYLEPQAVYGTVQQFGATSGSGIAISAATLWKRMDEAGLLQSTEREGRGTRYVRRSFASTRRKVLHLPVDVLDAGESEDVDEHDTEAEDHDGDGEERTVHVAHPPSIHDAAQQAALLPGQSDWAGNEGVKAQTDTGFGPKRPWNHGAGQSGQVGQAKSPRPQTGATTCVHCGRNRTIWPSKLCPMCEEAGRDPAA